MKEYRKSYLGLVLWLIAFCMAETSCFFLPINEIKMQLAFFDNIMTVSLFLLTYIIYKTEYVYWYNGTEFTAAKEAGKERRKRFAAEHMKRFGYFTLTFFIYTIISYLLKFPYGIDISMVVIGTIAAAISTVKIKL